MPDYGETVKAKGLIERGTRERVGSVADRKDSNRNELAREAFRTGLAHYASSGETVPEADAGELVEDPFSYFSWQVDLFDQLREGKPEMKWADFKTAFIEKGLDILEDQ
jgi:hypothetical protein